MSSSRKNVPNLSHRNVSNFVHFVEWHFLGIKLRCPIVDFIFYCWNFYNTDCTSYIECDWIWCWPGRERLINYSMLWRLWWAWKHIHNIISVLQVVFEASISPTFFIACLPLLDQNKQCIVILSFPFYMCAYGVTHKMIQQNYFWMFLWLSFEK